MVKNLPANIGDTKDAGSTPGVEKIPWRRKQLEYLFAICVYVCTIQNGMVLNANI